MSQLIEVLRVFAADLLTSAGPTVVFGAAGAVLGGLLALGLTTLCLRLVAWRRRGSVRVASLAARGASRAEIARRTGLSQDAVAMLLSVRPGHRSRRNLPHPARIAASHRGEARRRNRDWNPQAVAGAGDTTRRRASSQSARPLPSAGATSKRLTRAGQAV